MKMEWMWGNIDKKTRQPQLSCVVMNPFRRMRATFPERGQLSCLGNPDSVHRYCEGVIGKSLLSVRRTLDFYRRWRERRNDDKTIQPAHVLETTSHPRNF